MPDHERIARGVHIPSRGSIFPLLQLLIRVRFYDLRMTTTGLEINLKVVGILDVAS
jgi:hypothetical protein